MSPIRVKIPRKGDPVRLLELAIQINEKQLADTSASPLGGDLASKWAVASPKLAAAQQLQDEAKALELLVAQKYEARNQIVAEIDPLVRYTCDQLLTHYGKINVRYLSQYGFQLETAQPRIKRKDKVDSSNIDHT